MEHIKQICPYCKVKVSFSWLCLNENGGRLNNFFSEYYENSKGVWTIAECPSCNKCVLLELKRVETFPNHFKLPLKQIYPYPLPSKTDDRIPKDIRKDIEEAKLCFSVRAFRGCAVMCRRAIQQACIKEGANKNNNLEKQIDELKDKGIITKHIRKWAHSCRFVGNDASHPGNPEVSEEDAKDVLNLAEQLMNILYVMPTISENVNKLHKKGK